MPEGFFLASFPVVAGFSPPVLSLPMNTVSKNGTRAEARDYMPHLLP